MLYKLIESLFVIILLFSNAIFATTITRVKDIRVSDKNAVAATQINLRADSTKSQPTYFACLVTPSRTHPTLSKWTPPMEFTQVYLLNYAQNVQGFNGLGLLKTTAGYLNQHYFRAYHDPDFKKSTPGFVDAFVLWAGYDINCMEINKEAIHPHYTGPLTLNFSGKTYHLALAGSEFN